MRFFSTFFSKPKCSPSFINCLSQMAPRAEPGRARPRPSTGWPKKVSPFPSLLWTEFSIIHRILSFQNCRNITSASAKHGWMRESEVLMNDSHKLINSSQTKNLIFTHYLQFALSISYNIITLNNRAFFNYFTWSTMREDWQQKLSSGTQ